MGPSNNLKRVPPSQMYGQTSDLQEEINGLWKLSRKVCQQSLAWRLLRDLEERRLGTNEVEADSLKRAWNRSVKKGYQNGIKEFRDSGEYKRDKEYVRGLIHLRAEQAKVDWSEARRIYREKKEKLKRECESRSKNNLYKATIKKIRNKFQSVYEQGRRGH